MILERANVGVVMNVQDPLTDGIMGIASAALVMLVQKTLIHV